jgi:hypothetical protein
MAKSIHIYTKKIRPKPSVVFDTYWKFADERQKIFFKRLNGESGRWTDDPILRVYKFTNAYRVADRVSQYLIKDVIYAGSQEPQEMLFRILLFKLFNKIETWEAVRREVGEITYSEYSFDRYNRILERERRKGNSIYSSAYIMASGSTSFGKKFKHQNHLELLDTIIQDDVAEKLPSIPTMEQLYNLLKTYPTIGSFLAYQYAIDINYSPLTQYSEMEFVKAGPGAIDGIKKCFVSKGEYSEEDIIKWMADIQCEQFERLGLEFPTLWGRNLQLIDIQNLFCEVDKYSRIAHPDIAGKSNRTRIKQKYIDRKLDAIDFFLPPKWGVKIS